MFIIIKVSKNKTNYYIIGGLCALVLMGCTNTVQSSVASSTKAVATTSQALETSKVAKSESEQSSSSKEIITTSKSIVENPVAVTPVVARPQVEPKAVIPTVLTPVNTPVKQDETSVAVAKTEKETTTPTTTSTTTAQTTTQTTTIQTTTVETTTKETKPAVVTAPARQLPYYSQNGQYYSDIKYGNYTLGATGCVPTSLAMALSHLNGYTISPTTVADYLYENTDQFNKSFIGTSGIGVSLALSNWGHSAHIVTSLDQLVSELKNGRLVYAAVQGGYFTPSGTHAVILTGYDEHGNTTVYNPHSNYGVQTVPVSRVWDNQSWDSDDRALGSPILAIY